MARKKNPDPSEYNKGLKKSELLQRRIFITTLLYIGMNEDLISEKLEIPMNIIMDDLNWIFMNRPDVIAQAKQQFIDLWKIDPSSDITSEFADKITKVYSELDPKTLQGALKQMEGLSESEPDLDTILGADEDADDDVDMFQMDEDEDDDEDTDEDPVERKSTLSPEEESEFNDLASELNGISAGVYKDVYLKAAMIVSVQWVARPVLGGHLFGRVNMINSFLDSVMQDVKTGMYKLHSSPMVMGVAATLVDVIHGGGKTLDPSVMLAVSLRPDWMANGGATRGAKPDEIEAISTWFSALKSNDPEAMAYVDSIPTPIGVQIDDEGNLTPGNLPPDLDAGSW